jgi:transcriptional regulator with XRE-family HTH domain
MRQTGSPLVRAIIKSINDELENRGWTRQYLAQKIGRPRDGLCKYLRLTQKKPDFELIWDIAQALNTTIEELAGGQVCRLPNEFEPSHHSPTLLLDKFAEHEKAGGRFLTFDRLPACPRMTSALQNKLHLSLFGPISGTKKGVRLIESWNEWGDARRERYLKSDRDVLPTVTTMMLRSDFEKMIKAEPPFDCCTLEEVRDCLEHLRLRCVRERGFRLVLIDDERLPRDLRLQLDPLDAIGVIGRNFVFSKTSDTTVVWKEEKRHVESAVLLLRRLHQLRSHNADVVSILSQLDEYQRIIDAELADRLRQNSKQSLDKSWDRVRANIPRRPK